MFHYLGPAFAVLLFEHLAPLGVAWLRITSAAIVFALWRRPWRSFLAGQLSRSERRNLLSLGVVLALMNSCFYEAIARLPMGTVGAIEFLGPIALAVWGAHTRRNFAALGLTIAGVYLLADIRITSEPLGYVFAFANCGLFVAYIVLGHRLASSSARIDRLSVAMAAAMITSAPLGISDALPALSEPALLGAAIGVGISSSSVGARARRRRAGDRRRGAPHP